MVMIVYNEAMDMEVMEILEGCALPNYTKITGVYGRGRTSGTHLGNDVWPGKNNILYVACPDERTRELLAGVKVLRKKLGQEGIKAFVWNLDDVT